MAVSRFVVVVAIVVVIAVVVATATAVAIAMNFGHEQLAVHRVSTDGIDSLPRHV